MYRQNEGLKFVKGKVDSNQEELNTKLKKCIKSVKFVFEDNLLTMERKKVGIEEV